MSYQDDSLSDNELLHTTHLWDILSCHTVGVSNISESDWTMSDGRWQSESLCIKNKLQTSLLVVVDTYFYGTVQTNDCYSVFLESVVLRWSAFLQYDSSCVLVE